jgi:hypothetical protein
MPDGVYLLRDVEDFLDKFGDPAPHLIFTSPPFGTTTRHVRWLAEVFRKLAAILPEHGSMVVTLGNCWAPPVQTTDTLDLLKVIRHASVLDLLQMFVVIHEDARMSPSVASKMQNVDHAPDHVSYAWRLGRPSARWAGDLSRFPSNVVEASVGAEERLWLKEQGYHAALPRSVPEFFIRGLTAPGDLVMDPFAGLNATGAAAELTGRRWLSLDTDPVMLRKALTRP